MGVILKILQPKFSLKIWWELFKADKNIIDIFNQYYENLTEENKQFISKISTYEKPEFYICFTDC